MLNVSVFEYLNQKVMYIQDVNYYFGIRNDFDIRLGDYEFSEEEILNIAKENDPEEYEIFINTSIEDRLSKINTYDIEKIKKIQLTDRLLYVCTHQEGVILIASIVLENPSILEMNSSRLKLLKMR